VPLTRHPSRPRRPAPRGPQPCPQPADAPPRRHRHAPDAAI